MKKNNLIVLVLVVSVLVFLGYLLVQKKSTTKIATETSLKDDPFVGIMVDSGLDQATQEALQRQIDLTKEAFDSNPYSWESWVFVGNLHKLFKNYDKAIEAYEQANKLKSNNSLGYRNMAILYKNDLEDYKKAEEFYLLAIENSKDDPTLYIDLALIYENRLNMVDRAEDYYLVGLENTKNDSEILVRLIRFYQRQDNDVKVKETATLLLRLYPENSEFKTNWGHLAK